MSCSNATCESARVCCEAHGDVVRRDDAEFHRWSNRGTTGLHMVSNPSNTFDFIGKKGKEHHIEVTDQDLIELINECEEIPGWELFKYYDENGNKDCIDSGMINEYIQNICGEFYSAKDFRTWAATKIFFEALRELGYVEDEKQNAKNILTAYDASAKGLGNTRSVCRSYYVHPVIPEAYTDGSIVPYFEKVDQVELIWNGKSSEITNVVLPFQIIEQVLSLYTFYLATFLCQVLFV